jgi:FlaA1/EpsC-like NDP-sugar epimerase
MHRMLKEISRTNGVRRFLVCAAQAIVFSLSGLLAFLLRFDFHLPSVDLRYFLYALPVWVIIKSVVFQIANLNRPGMRYVSIADIYRLVAANFAGSTICCLVILGLEPPGFPRSIYLSDLILSFLGTAGLRIVVRTVIEGMRAGSNNAPEKLTLIYGAGDAGVILLKEIRNNPRLAYHVRGFIDDRESKRGLSVSGVTVMGGGDDIRALVCKHKIEMILIAIPSATGTQMTRILSLCHAAGIGCKTIPGLGEVIEGYGLAGQIRDVAVEDLLGRTPVRLNENKIRGTIHAKVVLVTGAAGSIGSELCRQIARFSPAAIVGFEIAESPLFEIDREMRRGFPQVPFHPEIGSIQNRARLDEVLEQYRPEIIYHAAAYKHVPLMEEHIFEAIENNVFGTLNIAEAAADHGVENFVMISSDKAVRPANVMGVTKRIAEILLLALQNGGTQYIAVRFGNVLGSNGSVIPIFKKQIAAGGPITVTHPEMRRFFMTIPEACQLVLQASTIGKGGQICVLDMGQPVKIIDLARNLILLSGLRPDEDIKIDFTGMRPGEKLYEELSTLLEDTIPSDHEKVRIFVGNGMPEADVMEWLASVREICEARELGKLVLALKEMVLDYNPSADLLKRMVASQDLRVPLSAPDPRRSFAETSSS